jgi:hypothetical protein
MEFLAMAQQKISYEMFYFECFSRTMIEPIYQCVNLVIGYVLKIATFGKVLPHKPGIFSFTPPSRVSRSQHGYTPRIGTIA